MEEIVKKETAMNIKHVLTFVDHLEKTIAESMFGFNLIKRRRRSDLVLLKTLKWLTDVTGQLTLTMADTRAQKGLSFRLYFL